jgi:hypothetical protein
MLVITANVQYYEGNKNSLIRRLKGFRYQQHICQKRENSSDQDRQIQIGPRETSSFATVSVSLIANWAYAVYLPSDLTLMYGKVFFLGGGGVIRPWLGPSPPVRKIYLY